VLHLELKKRQGDFQLDVAIRAPTPGLIALFGRSGCGKSTIIHLIAGLLRPDEGRVVLDADALFDSARHVNLPAERRRLGYVFQDSRLFPHYDVLGNLRYGEKRAPRAQVAQRIGFDEIVDLLGIGTLLKRRPHQLSGGERQRVAIGRALLSQPRLLLLDEPLASLDATRKAEILPYLERLRDEAAVPMVYVSHHADEVRRIATSVVRIEAGCVAAVGGLELL
jgi:molybdate transport system ATP-binding protein